MIFPVQTFAQVNGETQEIPKILMSVNEIRDFPVAGLRNFIITTPGVVDIQSIPTNILRIKVIGSGSTIVYIWDSQGRKTLQIEVTGLATNQITTFRPGYDPAGTEFIYHTTMNNQLVNGESISPFWNHELSASVPFRKTDEWRTLLRASTIDFGPAEASQYAPFSNSTVLDQFLSYYQTPNFTAALGDVNYNAGELSVTGFPLRGGSFQLYSDNRQDQVQIFGGASRPRLRTTDLFSDPMENFYGAAGTKEIFPGVSLKSSFVYLDQASSASLFGTTPAENDFVADVGFIARPFTDMLNFEGEYGRSKDDSAIRVLGEYTPFWGRVMASYKTVGSAYINPSSFFLQRNFNETNFITDIKPVRKIGLTFNYQLSQLKADPVLLVEKTTIHRVQLTGLYQDTEEKSYLAGLSVTRADSVSSPQNTERADLTYQRFFTNTRNQFYAQFFGQHSKNYFITEYTERFGGGTDIRYTKNFSRTLQLYLQNTLQLNRVHSTFSNFGAPPTYIETIASIGPTINYVDNKKTLSGGFYETFTFQDTFDRFSHLLQPFLTAYYNLSQALSFGARLNLNIDFTNDTTTYLSTVAELIYRFGTRVPDTLFSTFVASAHITGMVYIDANNDGEYQPKEKIITNYTVTLNDGEPVTIKDERFFYKVDSGPNKVMIELPKEYQGYQFASTNPAFLDLFPRETKMLAFGISQRIPINGRVTVEDPNDRTHNMERGLESVKIDISGEGFDDMVQTSAAGNFNSFVTKPGKYFAKIRTIDLPRGYKYTGPAKIEFTVEEGKITRIPPFVVQARRFVIGRAFVDKNGNNAFDEDDMPAKGIKIKIGPVTTQSEDDGTFSISSLALGNYLLTVEPKIYQGAHLMLLTDRVNVPEAGTIEIDIPYQR